MKKTIGVLIILLSVAFATLLILRIWGIKLVSTDDIWRSGVTLLVLGVLIVLLLIIYGGFYRKKDGRYDLNSGSKAHPKI